MRLHKTVAQVILTFFFVNFVLAAPAVREKHEARNGAMVQVLAEDVGAVAEKRFLFFKRPIIPWGKNSDLDSGDEGYETASDDEGYETASDDEGYATASDEPSGHSSTPTARPKIMTPEKIKAIKIVTGVGLLTAAVLGLVDIQISHQNTSAS